MRVSEGKTVEAALQAASEQVNVPVDQLKYFVIEEKAPGLFGLGGKAVIEYYCQQDIQDFLQSYLDNYFQNINLPATVEINKEDNVFKIAITADNNAVIIGKQGQTLEAIKTITNAAANAEFKCHVHMNLDINNYKEERYEKLRKRVKGIAKTVRTTKISATLSELTSDERRVVHQCLSDYPNIRTESEGEGKNRKLKIIYDPDKN